MARQKLHSRVWRLVRSQHGAITRRQLIDLGFTDEAVDHRIRTGRLHPVYRGVYAVGRPELIRHGHWMAATLACGPSGALSHGSAAALWGIGSERGGIEVSVPRGTFRQQPGIWLHRRAHLETATHHRIPVTTPTATIIDLASYLPRNETEHAINEATDRKLTDPDLLRAAVHEAPPTHGAAKLRKTLDILTFVLTRSELERLFLPIARRAGLPKPITKPDPHRRRPDSPPLHARPGQVPARPRRGDPPKRYTSSIVSASSPTSRNDV